MRFLFSCVLIAVFLCFSACHSDEIISKQKTITKEEQLRYNLDSLNRTALNGDLVVRLTDDIISQQVSQLSETDKSYSHAGIIVVKDKNKFVYDIGPNLPGADTIEITPVDSFLNPEKNIKCALYRYDMSGAEQGALIQLIEKYKAADTRFDMVYDLQTDDKLYCSEMIYKALKLATNNRITPKENTMPARFHKMLVAYFKKQGITKEIIATRKYIPLDHLYLLPECKEIMKFDLKIFPGQ